MKTVVQMEGHDFQKKNLVTTSKGDLYECSVCRATGYRNGLLGEILLTSPEFKKSQTCTFVRKRITHRAATQLLVYDNPQFGLVEGFMDTVPCPKEFQKYSNDIWVYSVLRKEPVRLLSGEYEFIEKMKRTKF